jgi:hypothetical protein
MMEQEGKSMEQIQRYDHSLGDRSLQHGGSVLESYMRRNNETGEYVLYADHIAALAAKDRALADLRGSIHASNKEFTRDSATLEAQAEHIRVLREALEECIEVACDATCDRVSQPTPIHTRECKIARAALASTAPVAEKEFKHLHIGNGKTCITDCPACNEEGGSK